MNVLHPLILLQWPYSIVDLRLEKTESLLAFLVSGCSFPKEETANKHSQETRFEGWKSVGIGVVLYTEIQV